MTKNLVFIASGGRTGTQFFGDMLGMVIEDCWSEHEPDMADGFSRLTLTRLRRFGVWHMLLGRLAMVTGIRPLGHLLLTGRLPEDACLRRLRRSRERYHASIAESLVVESYFRWWMFAGRIHKVWPGAKTIGIVRDPRDWIESWLRHEPRVRGLNWKEWCPPGPLTARAIGDLEWAEQWDQLGPVGRLAWDWRTIYRILDRAVDEASNVRMFRFEDLFGPEDRYVRELVAFAADHGERQYKVHDLTGFTVNARNASKGPRRAWPDWPYEQARLLDAMCGPLMRKYGYGLEPEWQAKLHGNESRTRTEPTASKWSN